MGSGEGLEGLREVEDRAEGRAGAAARARSGGFVSGTCGLWGSEPRFSSLNSSSRNHPKSLEIKFYKRPR